MNWYPIEQAPADTVGIFGYQVDGIWYYETYPSAAKALLYGCTHYSG
jgi:hypothetical protein